MKKLIPLTVCVVVLSGLWACRTHKTATALSSVTQGSLTDSTRTASDTIAFSVLSVDTLRARAEYLASEEIEFEEGGGEVRIDSAGSLTLSKVRKARLRRKKDTETVSASAISVSHSVASAEKQNAVRAEEYNQLSKAETREPAPHWYDKPLEIIGLGVCLAIICWIIFLYLKRKY